MARVSLIVLVLLGAATGLVFAADPALDLQVASFFHGLATLPGIRKFDHAIEVFRKIGPALITAAIVPAVVTLAMKTVWPRRATPMSACAALFVLVTLALGPGLLVNRILKENWARPRPGMVMEFGGDHAFKPWWDPRGTCDTNCSFVSGETSSAVWMTAPALMLPAPWRYAGLAAAGLYVVTVAFIRMLAGGHFLSDVIFAGVFTGLVMWAVHGVLFRWHVFWLCERWIDAAQERFGGAPAAIVALARDIGTDKRAPPA